MSEKASAAFHGKINRLVIKTVTNALQGKSGYADGIDWDDAYAFVEPVYLLLKRDFETRLEMETKHGPIKF